MLQRILDVLRGPSPDIPAGQAAGDPGYDRTVAVAALLVEMAMIDGEFTDEERARIVGILKGRYGVEERDMRRLLETAEAEARQSTGYWQLTSAINQNYEPEEKRAIVGLLWDVIHADGTVEKHEDYLVRKLSRLLGVPHQDMIAAKLRSRSS